MYFLSNTAADTLYNIIKDILLWCSLLLSLCRGQAYDGAANMQEITNGVVTKIQKNNPAALNMQWSFLCTGVAFVTKHVMTESNLIC